MDKTELKSNCMNYLQSLFEIKRELPENFVIDAIVAIEHIFRIKLDEKFYIELKRFTEIFATYMRSYVEIENKNKDYEAKFFLKYLKERSE